MTLHDHDDRYETTIGSYNINGQTVEIETDEKLRPGKAVSYTTTLTTRDTATVESVVIGFTVQPESVDDRYELASGHLGQKFCTDDGLVDCQKRVIELPEWTPVTIGHTSVSAEITIVTENGTTTRTEHPHVWVGMLIERSINASCALGFSIVRFPCARIDAESSRPFRQGIRFIARDQCDRFELYPPLDPDGEFVLRTATSNDAGREANIQRFGITAPDEESIRSALSEQVAQLTDRGR